MKLSSGSINWIAHCVRLNHQKLLCESYAFLSSPLHFVRRSENITAINQLRSVCPLRFTRSQTPLHPNFNPEFYTTLINSTLTCTSCGLPHLSCHPFETSVNRDVILNFVHIIMHIDSVYFSTTILLTAVGLTS